MQTTPTNKESSTKSTTAARVAATSGPTTMAIELRKTRKRKAAASDDFNEVQQVEAAPAEPVTQSNNMPMTQNTETRTGPASHNTEPGIILKLVPLPSFFEESIDIFPTSPSPNASISQSQLDMLAAPRDEPMTSTSAANISVDTPATPVEADQSFTSQTKSLKNRVLEAEERGGPLGNPTIRSPLYKYTKAPMPPIHYAHPTAILDHLDVNLIGDWEDLPKGKLLAQPFGPDVRNIEQHPSLKAQLFAAIVEITSSRDVSVSAPKAKANSYRTPFSFLIYNISEEQSQTLLKRHVWSSTAISFSVSTLNPNCPDYLFSIKGLTTMDKDEVRNAINEVWRDPASLVFLREISQSFPANLQAPVTHTLKQFIDSLKVARLDTKLRGNTIAPVFNVYANGTLIDDDNTWTLIRSYYASRTYAFQAQDPGQVVIAPFKCGICHAADHPRGLCPFPIVEGWNGLKRRDTPGGSGGAGPGPGPDAQK